MEKSANRLDGATSTFLEESSTNTVSGSSSAAGTISSPNQTEISQIELKKSSNETQTILGILKAFIGTGALFLPHAFRNGGLGLSACIMTLSFVVSIYCILLLITICENENLDSFGEIADKACGKVGRVLVNISITLSQLAFCTVYGIFVASNIRDVVYSISGCNPSYLLPVLLLIVLQGLIYIPSSWVRRIRYFAPAMLIAAFCIGVGFFLIFCFVILKLHSSGAQPVHLINLQSWPIMMGTCIYLWEGIGLVLPVRASMQHHIKYKFPTLLVLSLSCVFAIFLLYAICALFAYGDGIASVVLFNLPNSYPAYLVQCAYTAATLVSYPFVLFPAAKVVEDCLVTTPSPNARDNVPCRSYEYKSTSSGQNELTPDIEGHASNEHIFDSGRCYTADYYAFMQKEDDYNEDDVSQHNMFPSEVQTAYLQGAQPRKWKKNSIRTILVCITLFTAYNCLNELDNFVAIVGALCCVPLSFIYPALFHLLLCTSNKSQHKRNLVDRAGERDGETLRMKENRKHSWVGATSYPGNEPCSSSGIASPLVGKKDETSDKSRTELDRGPELHSHKAGANIPNDLVRKSNISGYSITGSKRDRIVDIINGMPRKQSIVLDLLIIVLGTLIMVFTATQALSSWHSQELQYRCGVIERSDHDEFLQWVLEQFSHTNSA